MIRALVVALALLVALIGFGDGSRVPHVRSAHAQNIPGLNLPALVGLAGPLIVSPLGTYTQTSGTSIIITTSATVPVGSTIIVSVDCNSTCAATSATDQVSNSYTAVDGGCVSTCVSNFEGVQQFYSKITTSLPSSDTITVSGCATFCRLGLAAVISNAGALDKSGNWASGTSGAAPSTTTGTLAQSYEVVIGIISNETTPTQPGGFTQINTATEGSIISTWAYQIVESTASVTYNPTQATSGYAINAFTFRGL